MNNKGSNRMNNKAKKFLEQFGFQISKIEYLDAALLEATITKESFYKFLNALKKTDNHLNGFRFDASSPKVKSFVKDFAVYPIGATNMLGWITLIYINSTYTVELENLKTPNQIKNQS